MFLVMNLSTSQWVFVLVGIASTHLDTQSTATSIYSFPSEGEKGPMKSIPHRSNISTSRINISDFLSHLEMFNVA